MSSEHPESGRTSVARVGGDSGGWKKGLDEGFSMLGMTEKKR